MNMFLPYSSTVQVSPLHYYKDGESDRFFPLQLSCGLTEDEPQTVLRLVLFDKPMPVTKVVGLLNRVAFLFYSEWLRLPFKARRYLTL